MAKRGLIVDDAAFMRMMLRGIFENNGYEVAGEATNGKEAVEQYGSSKPDFVTLDITMPEMDGIEALKQIISMDSGATVIMCSAIGQQANVLEAIKTGAKDFIVKPFQPDRVVESFKKGCRLDVKPAVHAAVLRFCEEESRSCENGPCIQN